MKTTQDKKSYFQREKDNRRSYFNSRRSPSDDQGDKFDRKRNKNSKIYNIPDIDLDDEE